MPWPSSETILTRPPTAPRRSRMFCRPRPSRAWSSSNPGPLSRISRWSAWVSANSLIEVCAAGPADFHKTGDAATRRSSAQVVRCGREVPHPRHSALPVGARAGESLVACRATEALGDRHLTPGADDFTSRNREAPRCPWPAEPVIRLSREFRRHGAADRRVTVLSRFGIGRHSTSYLTLRVIATTAVWVSNP